MSHGGACEKMQLPYRQGRRCRVGKSNCADRLCCQQTVHLQCLHGLKVVYVPLYHVPLYHLTLEILVLSTSCCGALIPCNHNDHTLVQACHVLQFCIIYKCSRVTLSHTQGRGADMDTNRDATLQARYNCHAQIRL